MIEPIVITVLSVVILLITNILLPGFLSPVIAFSIGVVGILRIFLRSGQLTWKRDLYLFGFILTVILLTRLLLLASCSYVISSIRCEMNYLHTIMLINIIFILLPIIFIWSWIRFRIIKYRFSKRDRDEIIKPF